MSERFFWALWESCSVTEKLALVQITEEGFANPRQRVTIARLLRRGLLVLRPDVQPFSSDFAAYIREVRDPARVRSWEHATGGAIGWGSVKWVMAAILVGVAAFLLSTQRDSVTAIVGFVSTLTAAVAGVLKLLGGLTPGAQQAGDQG
jgi:hypothetical protein